MREIELCGGQIVLQVGEAHHLPNEAGCVVWDAALALTYYLQGASLPAIAALQLGFGT